MRSTRRELLKRGAAAGALLGLGDLSFLAGLRPVSAEETQLPANAVRLDPGIEPIVRLIEQTPRERLLEEIAARIRKGLSYRDVLAALLLAGVRNVQPRPSVGHKFHAVLVVNSAHLASLSSPPEHRWLPIFWALDHYKSSEAQDVRENNWTMSAVDENSVPAAHQARAAFTGAMDKWDDAAADAAVAGLARSAGANEIFDLFVRYGARDFRSIGHKAIYVANSYRTLQCIGWQHAEPVLRSLAYALLMHDGSNPAQGSDEADRPGRRNAELAQKIGPEWLGGRLDDGATRELLATLRTGSNDEVCDQVVSLLGSGIAAQSVWDALFVGAGELLMRQPGIVALHAVTTTNALRYAFEASGDDEARKLALLQNAAFLPMFRDAMAGRGSVSDMTLESLQPAEVSADAPATVEAIFGELDSNPMAAASKTLGFLRQEGDSTARAQEMIDAARVLVFLKGDNAHDYKFSSAVLEDYEHVSPAWRDTYMALNVFKLRGSQSPDNQLVQRTRAALA